MVYGGNTSCIQIAIDGVEDLIIVDCGTGIRNLGNHANGHGRPLKGKIFVTHPHWDHLQGFPFFKPFYEGKNSFEVYMPPQNGAGCKEILQGHLSSTFFPISIDMLEAELECNTLENLKADFRHFTVEYLLARHPVPTAIYKFTVEGHVIIIGPDNELPLSDTSEDQKFIKDFRDFVRGADVLIHDSQFNKEEHASRIGWGHSNWESLIEKTEGLGIRHLVMTHHDPDNHDGILEEREQKIKTEHSSKYESLSLAKEVQILTLK